MASLRKSLGLNEESDSESNDNVCMYVRTYNNYVLKEWKLNYDSEGSYDSNDTNDTYTRLFGANPGTMNKKCEGKLREHASDPPGDKRFVENVVIDNVSVRRHKHKP